MTSMLDFSRPHLLRDDEEYDAAVAEVDTLLDLDPERGTEDFERLEFLSLLIETYETEHEPWGDDPVPPQSIASMYCVPARGVQVVYVPRRFATLGAVAADWKLTLVLLRFRPTDWIWFTSLFWSNFE